MSAKAEIIFVWGAALVVARAIMSGDLSALIQIISKQATPGAPAAADPGFAWRLIGSLAFIIVLMLMADASDDAADMALWLLAGLTLVFVMFNIGTVQSWLTKIGV